jgi:hypothetical protein
MFKADYGLDRAGFQAPEDKARHFVLRGKDRDARRKDRKQHPTFTWLGNLLDGSDAFPEDMTWTKGGILTIRQWLHFQGLDVGDDIKALRPGDNLPEQEYRQRYNNVHMRIRNLDEWKTRITRKKVRGGKHVQWFEKFGPGGTAEVHMAMFRDRLDPGL